MSDVRLWTFAKYRIRDIVDVDLVSTTYRATTVDDDALCRLRVFTRESSEDHAVVEVQDAVITAALRARQVRHPNILNTHDAGRHDGRVYVVSDHINGSMLREFIVRNSPVEPTTAVAMGWRLAEALDAVHAGGIVHGSINPHTIWVADSTGREPPMTYLTGFGAARALAREVKIQGGTPNSDDLLYVEPQHVRHPQPSPEADRYALACAVYHLITGVPPFSPAAAGEGDGAPVSSTTDAPSTVRHGLPQTLDAVFSRAFADETNQRYPSAHALMTAVERALRQRSDDAAPSTAAGSGDAPRASEHDVMRAAFSATDADAISAALAAVGDDAAEAPARDEEEETTERLDLATGGTETADVDGAAEPSRPETDSLSPSGTDVDWASAVAAEPDPVIEEEPEPVEADGGSTPDADTVSASSADRLSGADGVRPSAAELARALSQLADGARPSARTEETDAVPRQDHHDPVSLRPEKAHPPPDSDEVDRASPRSDRVHQPSERSDQTDQPSGWSDKADQPSPRRFDFQDLQWATADGTEPPRTAEADGMAPPDAPEGNAVGAAGVEARRAARERGGAELPRVALPPRRPAAASQSSDPRFAEVLDFLRAHRGVVLLALSTMATIAIVTTALAMRYSGQPQRGVAANAAPGDQQQERADEPGIVHPVWSTPVESQPIRSVAVSSDVLLVAADTAVAAIDPNSGRRLWRTETDGKINDVAMVRNVAIAATADGVSGYDVASGRPQWTLSSEDVDPDALVAGAREVYAAERDDLGGIVLSAITPTGSVESLGTVPDEGVAGNARGRSALAFDPGKKQAAPTLYLLTRSGLHAFDVKTQTVRWRALVDGGRSDAKPRLRARPWIPSLTAAGGAVFVADRDGGVCRYAGDSGEEVWTECQDLPAGANAAPEIQIRGGRVIAASDDALAAYNFTNGRPVWMHTSRKDHTAVASGPEAAFVAYAGGGLEALDHASGRQQWRAPDVGEAQVLVADKEGVFVGGTDGSISRLRQPGAAGSDRQ